MADTNEKLDKADVAEENIDEILSNIKDVITSSSAPDSVLVLTEQVEEEMESASANDKAAEPKEAEPTISAAAQNMPKGPDILDQLDAGTAKPEKLVPVFPSEEPESITFAKQAATPTAPAPISAPAESPMPDATLVRDDVALATQAAISQMLHAGDATETQVVESQPLFASKSFEEVAKALLRAELQTWLNANLEGMVKTIVESEIKRIMPK